MKLPVFKKTSGFTLIELLVVIALIGILAVAVLSALDPIEQTNKAKDAKMQADASQLVGAIDRFYAVNLYFPWTVYESGTSTSNDALFGAAVYAQGIGICGILSGDEIDLTGFPTVSAAGTGGCGEDGLLIVAQELKAGFGNRDYFSERVGEVGYDKTLWLFKNDGETVNYICFKPSAKVNKIKADLEAGGESVSPLKYLTFTENVGDGSQTLPTDIERCDPSTMPSGEAVWGSVDPNDWCFMCVPE